MVVRALKEWSAAVHALLAGRQVLLLRKGGIHEKRFVLPEPGGDPAGGTPFLLFPTVSHAHRGRVRPERRLPQLGRAARSHPRERPVRPLDRLSEIADRVRTAVG